MVAVNAARSRRATAWRVTAGPTALLTISPSHGPPCSATSRRMRLSSGQTGGTGDACRTKSRAETRTPVRSVREKSDPREIRWRGAVIDQRTEPHDGLGCRADDQAVSFARPLVRRLFPIARPARVRKRNRKPCTRARRRLFGWKVRLPLATVTPCAPCVTPAACAVEPRLSGWSVDPGAVPN